MSVPASNNEEAEAMRRAQRAHEPSMEEILASIRAIIADDRDTGREAKASPQVVYLGDASPRSTASDPQPEAPPPPVAATPTVVWSRPAPEDVAPPRQEPPRQEPARQEPARQEPARQEPAPTRAFVEEPPAPLTPSSEEISSLLSEEAESSVADSFRALSENMAAQGLRVAEDMARDMLRPMIKAWLDQNLPSLVERLVRAEIQRVSRGGR